MTITGGIRVDLATIEQALEENGHDSCNVELVPTTQSSGRSIDGHALVAAVDEASEAANAAPAGPTMWGQGAFLTIDGAGLSLKDYWGPDSLTSWLTTFTDALHRQGYSGLVRATPVVRPPRWLRHQYEPRATAFVALQEPLTRAAAAERWARLATGWARPHGGDTCLAAGAILQHDTSPDVADHLAAGLLVNGNAALTMVDPTAPRAARARAEQDGMATYQAYAPAITWHSHIERIRQAILADAEHTRLAYVAMTPTWAFGWEDRGRDLPPLPAVPAHALRGNTPLWGRKVPDAHGIQLLSSAHLDQASDLSDWQITEVHKDRFLVEAPDPAAWFGPGGPAAAVIEQARADFGQLIVTGRDL
ncbi:hypothetical protein ACFWXO_13705 [Kitasatospora sp. NPDC059088]|uniref:hypothetical protein n=1 Tax=Kitasatospora sp. NPDC059088 TaxID=3346722 RepID=UPI003695B222